MLWFKAPPKIYFKRGSLDLGLAELKGWCVAAPSNSAAMVELSSCVVVEQQLP